MYKGEGSLSPKFPKWNGASVQNTLLGHLAGMEDYTTAGNASDTAAVLIRTRTQLVRGGDEGKPFSMEHAV